MTGLLLGNGVGTLMGWAGFVVTLAGLEAAAVCCSGVRVRRAVRGGPVRAFLLDAARQSLSSCRLSYQVPQRRRCVMPSGSIADPGLRSKRSSRRVLRHSRSAPRYWCLLRNCPSLNGAGEVAAHAALAHGCADGGSAFIAPAGSGSKAFGARLNDTVATHVAITPSLIKVICQSYYFPSVPHRPWFGRRHGAWADGSCWRNVILPLQQRRSSRHLRADPDDVFNQRRYRFELGTGTDQRPGGPCGTRLFWRCDCRGAGRPSQISRLYLGARAG